MTTDSLTKTKANSTKYTLFLLGIIFVAFNLRPAITSVGPLIGSIRDDTGISNAVAGFLTTLPLLGFGFLSLLAPKLGKRFGNEKTVFFGLIILGTGILLRSSGFIFTLFFGTALIGVGIAIGNVLLPGIVKHNFKKVGLMTAIYSTSMGVWAGLGSGFSVPLAQGAGLGWQKALAVWLILVVIALIMWVPQMRKPESSDVSVVKTGSPMKSSLWRSPLAWQVTFFMGLQSFLFYTLVAWLPEILHSRGLSISLAGWMLSLMQLGGLPASFIAPVLADRYSDQRGIIAGLGVLSLTGLIGLYFGGNIILVSFFIICIALSQGAAISLSLTFLGLRSANAQQAANLSGMAQSIGYFLAAAGPITIGYLYDTFQSWVIPLLLLIVISCLMIIAGLGAGRNKYVLDSKE